MKYQINWNCSDGVFAVPDLAADCLKLASGKSLKFLLYILKNKITDLPLAEIGKAVGISEEDAEDALSFWKQTGIISDAGAAAEASPAAVRTGDTHTGGEAVSAPRSLERSAKMITPAEISERINSSEETAFLFKAAETALGKVLTYTEQRTLIWLNDFYGIAPDLLIMIIEFAKSQNKANIGFIEKIAEQWHSDGISTHEQAEREILRMQNYYSLAGQIKSGLELDRTLTTTERKYISDWASKNISVELILYAYEKTVDSIGKVKFSYMNKILLDWYGKGYFTPSDVKKSEGGSRKASAKTAAENDEKHSYNLDLLVEHALNTVPKMKY